MSSAYDRHFERVRRGLIYHEARRYGEAIALFREAVRLSPDCPVALYNEANTLYCMGRADKACSILTELANASEADLRARCPDMDETPRSLQLDTYHMLFLSTLHATESWQAAVPFLREHLARRARGLVSLWTRAQVIADADELRKEFEPTARRVASWA